VATFGKTTLAAAGTSDVFVWKLVSSSPWRPAIRQAIVVTASAAAARRSTAAD